MFVCFAYNKYSMKPFATYAGPSSTSTAPSYQPQNPVQTAHLMDAYDPSAQPAAFNYGQSSYAPPQSHPSSGSNTNKFLPQYRPNVTSFPVSVSGFPPITVTSILPEPSTSVHNVQAGVQAPTTTYSQYQTPSAATSAFQIPPPTTGTPSNLAHYFYQPAQNVGSSPTVPVGRIVS